MGGIETDFLGKLITILGFKTTFNKELLLSQAAACDATNYTTSTAGQDITRGTLPIYWNTNL